MRVFLTGGTGLVGSHMAGALKERGHEVLALVRPVTRADSLAGVAEVVRGDMLDPAAELTARMRGCDALVHAAALVYRGRVSADDFRRLNVEGTDRVLRAAGAAGVSRALHVSSIAVYSPAAAASGNAEESWLQGELPKRVPYPWSKRAGEIAAWRVHEEGLVRLTTVRPGVIYGEHDRLVTPLVARVASWPLVPLPEGGRHTLPLVYAGNVAMAIAVALERAGTVGEAYNLSDDGPLALRTLIIEFARALGRRPRVIPVGRRLMSAALVLSELVTRMVPAGANVPRAVRRLMEDNAYSSEKARRELDWTEGRLTPPGEAVARTARWWRAAHSKGR